MTTDVTRANPAAIEPIPVLAPGQTMEGVTEQISDIVLARRTRLWWLGGLGTSILLVLVFVFSVTILFVRGVGIWGIQVPVAWGFAITNFVWWIGIGHAGTLISAILLLLRQEWRTSINRLAEAMTVFAVAQAALFPILHLGRPWLFYYLLPYPNTMNLPPQFRSPLVWDAFAVMTYASVSTVFWLVGMIPDLATFRDRATNKWVKGIYGILALGWRGSAQHWRRFHRAYYLVAALVTALVVSVHTIVSFDFAVAVVPGWHNTVYPPYFVAGAIYSGFAMVLVLIIPLRKLLHIENMITQQHVDNAAKVMLASGLIVAYGYLFENFGGLYSGDRADIQAILSRFVGPFAILYWLQITFNVIIPQLIWIRAVRRNKVILFLISVGILFGMWMERYVLITTNLARAYEPSKWGVFIPTIWDIATFAGTVGLFFLMMFAFLRVLPVVANYEMRELIVKKQERRSLRQARPVDGDGRGPAPRGGTVAGEEVTP
jgi:Ni/Fe-hydrogenase subunit HybB-like protein